MKKTVKRIPYGAWVEALGSKAPSFFLTQNVTSEQLFLTGDDPPQVGQTVQVRLIVENDRRSLDAQGRVIGHYRRGQRRRFTVRFTNLEPEQRVYLRSLLDEQRAA